MKKETVIIERDNALQAYNQAPADFKKILATLFGGQIVILDPCEQFKTWEDICKVTGEHPRLALPYPTPVTKKQVSANGLHKLDAIFAEFNRQIPDESNGFKDIWEPDYANEHQKKFEAWFVWSPAVSAFVYYATTYCTCTDTRLGARLCTNTDAKMTYIAKTFTNEWNEFLNPQL